MSEDKLLRPAEERALRPARDRAYFLRRAAQERSAADHASGEEARAAHKELAKRYRRLVSSRAEERAGETAKA